MYGQQMQQPMYGQQMQQPMQQQMYGQQMQQPMQQPMQQQMYTQTTVQQPMYGGTPLQGSPSMGSPCISPYSSNSSLTSSSGPINPYSSLPQQQVVQQVTQVSQQGVVQQSPVVGVSVTTQGPQLSAVVQGAIAQQAIVGATQRIYVLREGLTSYKDEFWVYDLMTEIKLFKVGQRFIDLTLGRTFVFEDNLGNMMMRIQEKPVHLTKTIDIETLDGRTIARVHREITLSTPCFSMKFHDRYDNFYNSEDKWKVTGDFNGYNFNVHHKSGQHIAQLARSLISGDNASKYANSYGIRVVGRHNDCLLIALALCVEIMMRGK